MEYYLETDPDKRKEIFDRLSDLGDDGANALRRTLFDNRHTDPKHPGRPVDRGLWEIMLMPINDKALYRILPWTAKSIMKSMSVLGIDESITDDDMSISAVYWEIRNAARRYYENCKGSRYARKWFGIASASEDEQLERTASDVYIMAEVIPEKYKLVEEMRIFSDAVRDEFTERSPRARQVYDMQRKL